MHRPLVNHLDYSFSAHASTLFSVGIEIRRIPPGKDKLSAMRVNSSPTAGDTGMQSKNFPSLVRRLPTFWGLATNFQVLASKSISKASSYSETIFILTPPKSFYLTTESRTRLLQHD